MIAWVVAERPEEQSEEVFKPRDRSKDRPAQHLVDVGQVHLKTVLLLIDRLGHPIVLAGVVQSRSSLLVDFQIAEGCGVVRALAQSGLGQVVVMRGAEQDDTLADTQLASSGPKNHAR